MKFFEKCTQCLKQLRILQLKREKQNKPKHPHPTPQNTHKQKANKYTCIGIDVIKTTQNKNKYLPLTPIDLDLNIASI
jgi:hypothetical protein